MGPEGGTAQAELFSDFDGLLSLAQEAQNLALAVAETIDRAAAGLEVVEDLAGDGAGQDGAAFVDKDDSPKDLVGGAGFLQPGGNAGFEGLEQMVAILLVRKDEDGCARQGGMQLIEPRRGQTVGAFQIGNDHVGRVSLQLWQGVQARVSAGKSNAWGAGDQCQQVFPLDRVLFDNGDRSVHVQRRSAECGMRNAEGEVLGLQS